MLRHLKLFLIVVGLLVGSYCASAVSITNYPQTNLVSSQQFILLTDATKPGQFLINYSNFVYQITNGLVFGGGGGGSSPVYFTASPTVTNNVLNGSNIFYVPDYLFDAYDSASNAWFNSTNTLNDATNKVFSAALSLFRTIADSTAQSNGIIGFVMTTSNNVYANSAAFSQAILNTFSNTVGGSYVTLSALVNATNDVALWDLKETNDVTTNLIGAIQTYINSYSNNVTSVMNTTSNGILTKAFNADTVTSNYLVGSMSGFTTLGDVFTSLAAYANGDLLNWGYYAPSDVLNWISTTNTTTLNLLSTNIGVSNILYLAKSLDRATTLTNEYLISSGYGTSIVNTNYYWIDNGMLASPNGTIVYSNAGNWYWSPITNLSYVYYSKSLSPDGGGATIVNGSSPAGTGSFENSTLVDLGATILASNSNPNATFAGTATPANWINAHTVYGVDNTGITDIVAALSVAITNLCPTNSYSANVLYFPPGKYLVTNDPSASGLQTILTLPYHFATIAQRGPLSTITFRGPSFAGNISGSLSGQTIGSTSADGGLSMGTNGAVFILTSTNSGSFFRSDIVGGVDSSIAPIFKDLTFVGPTNGHMAILNFDNVRGCSVVGCGFNVGQGHKNLIDQPSSNYVAIIGPPAGVSAFQEYRNVDIDGFGRGISFSEHARLDMVTIDGCFIGLQTKGGVLPSTLTGIATSDCTYMIDAGQGGRLDITGWDVENSTNGPSWLTMTYMVNDPNNSLYGQGTYELHQEGGLPDYSYTDRFNGCSNIKLLPQGGLSGVSTSMTGGADVVQSPSIYPGLGFPHVTFRSLTSNPGFLRVYYPSTNGVFQVQSSNASDSDWYYWSFSL